MDTSRNSYVLAFAVGVCVVISSGLALTATALKPIQAAAAEFDRQKNVMFAAGLVTPETALSRPELEQLYRERVTEKVIDLSTGTVADGMKPADLDGMKDAQRAQYGLLMEASGDAGVAYVIPVAGKGLWSILYGFLALEADGNTVRGITFYKHGETPGLGGNVEKPEWVALWPGKRILDDQGKLVGVIVKKSKIDPSVPAEKAHYVDGLSGATITSNGVTKLVRAGLEAYRPFFERLWRQ